MNKKKQEKKLFFSRTFDFLDHYLPEQAMKSSNTIETYRDALTVFRRYITDILHLSLRFFCFVLWIAHMICCLNIWRS